MTSQQLAYLPLLTLVSLWREEMVAETDNETHKTSSGLSNDSSAASSSHSGNSDEELQPQTKLQIFGEITWKGVPVEKVNELPNDIDGLKHYVIKDEFRNNLLTKCKDGRNWRRDSQTKWAGYRSVRYRKCNGLAFCPNKECLYYKEYQNENHFHTSKSGLCEICGAETTYKFCLATKYVAYKRLSKAHIFYVGSHTCKAKNSCPRPSIIVESAVAVDPTTPSSSIQSTAILKAIQEKRPWQEVKNITVSVIQEESPMKKSSRRKCFSQRVQVLRASRI